MKNLVLIGGGGHCRSVIEVAESSNYNILGILDPSENINTGGYKRLGTDFWIEEHKDKIRFSGIVTVGHTRFSDLRQKLYQRLIQNKVSIATIIASTALVSKSAQVNQGTVVFHKVVINSGAVIGENSIINTDAVIEHDSIIGDHCHISTGALVNGGVKIGNNCFIGSGAIIIQGVTIPDNCIIGAGSLVLKTVEHSGIWVGSPVRKVQ